VSPAKAPANEPIDAVYTWDGKGDLRYSLRSLGRYAPWVRKVYVVTAEQAPAWLARSRARLAVVKQEDLVRDRNTGPDAIAWQLFRIPGLSRQFLYLDANLFLGRPLNVSDFLTPKGGYRFSVESSDIPSGSTAETLLNSRFGNRSPRKKVAPTPRLLDRNFLEEVNRLWEKQIKQGGVSLETLYFYFLAENPMQRGAHEKAALAPDDYRIAPLAEGKQVAGMLFGGPRFFSLEGKASLAARVLLRVHYWRKSAFEKY
jgi:hypothetical protein